MESSKPRVLVVEDEGLVGFALCDDLEELGYVPLGPFLTMDAALEATQSAGFDIALVDINLKGVMSYPLIEKVMQSNTPLALMTGYTDSSVPDQFFSLPRLAKPFSLALLGETLVSLRQSATSPTGVDDAAPGASSL